MKSWAGGILVTALSSGIAGAADLGGVPVQAPAIQDWTGAYIGASVGYGWLRDVDYFFTPPLRSKGDDVIFGGHFGYLHQMGSFVLGAEAEFMRLDINFEGFPIDAENSFALKARGGFAFDRLLLTGHAGAVYATTNIDLKDWGWVVGGGIDYLITDNFVAGISYDHFEFDRFDGTLIDAKLNLVKARLSYKF
jgi:outer membrane immunogenic protein